MGNQIGQWLVVAQVLHTDQEGWSRSIQVPSFRVTASGPGEAEAIAREVINPVSLGSIDVRIVVAFLHPQS